jgi:hypothetical protein
MTIFFDTLLSVIAVAIVAFAVYSVSKLYQGQR